MAVDKKGTEQFYAPPPKLGNWEGFKQFLWNSETSQFLGRTGGSWGEFSKYFNFKYVVEQLNGRIFKIYISHIRFWKFPSTNIAIL